MRLLTQIRESWREILLTAILTFAVTMGVVSLVGDNVPSNPAANNRQDSAQPQIADSVTQPIHECVEAAQAPNKVLNIVTLQICGGKLTDKRNDELYAFMDYMIDKGNPPNLTLAYDCANNRQLLVNAGINDTFDVNKLEVDKFVPCPNGALHIRIDKGKLTLVNNTGTVEIIGETNIRTPNSKVVDEGWLIELDYARMAPVTTVDGVTVEAKQIKHLKYKHGRNVVPFMRFIREAGGTWYQKPNVDDEAFDVTKTYDIVFTWADLDDQKSKPAPVPFKWNCVARHPYGVAQPC